MTSRPSTAAPILAVLAVVVLLPAGGYIAAYLTLGKVVDLPGDGDAVARVYQAEWQARAFRPAAWIESKLRGVAVFPVT